MKTNLLILLFLLSCSHRSQMKKDYVVSGRCEKEFNQTKLSAGEAIWQNVAEASGKGGSYLVTGLGYSTDLIVSFTSGVVGSVAVCSPLIALSALSHRSGSTAVEPTGECLIEVGTAIGKGVNPKLGPKASKGTKRWQCPNIDYVADGLIKVAECYTSHGDNELAKQQLQKINEASVFQKCLSKKKKKDIESRLSKFSESV